MEKLNDEPRVGYARNAARKLLSEFGLGKPPIILREAVACLAKKYDLSVYPWAFSDKTNGVQVTKDKEFVIGYNKTQHPHRQRFTVAHEIGHLVLGHTSKNHTVELNDVGPEEIEANQFAAELLMPLQMLKNDLQKGFSNPRVLASRYWVSEEAMWLRLKECNLLIKLNA